MPRNIEVETYSRCDICESPGIPENTATCVVVCQTDDYYSERICICEKCLNRMQEMIKSHA